MGTEGSPGRSDTPPKLKSLTARGWGLSEGPWARPGAEEAYRIYVSFLGPGWGPREGTSRRSSQGCQEWRQNSVLVGVAEFHLCLGLVAVTCEKRTEPNTPAVSRDQPYRSPGT